MGGTPAGRYDRNPAVMDTKAMYTCPRHGTALVETHSGALRVWHCTTCRGLWLPSGAFHAQVGHVSALGRGRPAGLQCPNDGHPLTAVIHRGVEVDVCGSCGGVWFDHGELAKVLARSANPAARPGNATTGSHAHAAASAVDALSAADLAGAALGAVLEFLGGLAS